MFGRGPELCSKLGTQANLSSSETLLLVQEDPQLGPQDTAMEIKGTQRRGATKCWLMGFFSNSAPKVV